MESGLFNLDLLREDYDEEAARLYADSDVTSRLDAITAHEYEGHRHGGWHVEALRHAPSTGLPINDRAREIARAMQEGWRGRQAASHRMGWLPTAFRRVGRGHPSPRVRSPVDGPST